METVWNMEWNGNLPEPATVIPYTGKHPQSTEENFCVLSGK